MHFTYLLCFIYLYLYLYLIFDGSFYLLVFAIVIEKIFLYFIIYNRYGRVGNKEIYNLGK